MCPQPDPPGDQVGANPVDPGKPGSKLHLVCDGRGLPLVVAVTAANVNDATTLEGLLDDVPGVLGPLGRRRCRPGKVYADKAYDLGHCRKYLRRRGITARIARRGIESSTRLGPVSLAGGAGAVVAVVLSAAGGSVGSGFGAVVRVCAVGMRAGLLQPALARQGNGV